MGISNIEEILLQTSESESGESIRCRFSITNHLISTDDLITLAEFCKDFQKNILRELLIEHHFEESIAANNLHRKKMGKTTLTLNKILNNVPSTLPVVNFQKGSLIVDIIIGVAAYKFLDRMLFKILGDAFARTKSYGMIVDFLSRPIMFDRLKDIVRLAVRNLLESRKWSNRKFNISCDINFTVKAELIVKIQINKDDQL